MLSTIVLLFMRALEYGSVCVCVCVCVWRYRKIVILIMCHIVSVMCVFFCVYLVD
jgi:hypothetical protein